jgi:hypothetical protein
LFYTLKANGTVTIFLHFNAWKKNNTKSLSRYY